MSAAWPQFLMDASIVGLIRGYACRNRGSNFYVLLISSLWRKAANQDCKQQYSRYNKRAEHIPHRHTTQIKRTLRHKLMMKSTTIRMDDGLKREASEKLEALGLNFNTFVVMATKQLVAQNRIPFDLVVPDAPDGRDRA